MTVNIDPVDENEFTVKLNAEGLKSATVRGSLSTAGVQLVKVLGQLGSQLILARLLFPADFGLVAMVSPILGFIAVINNMGFGEAIVQSEVLNQERVSSLFWGSLAISGALFGAVAVLSPLAGYLYGDARVIPLLIVSAVGIPLSSLGAVPSALLSRHMRISAIQRNDLISTTVGIVITVGSAYFGASYWSLLIGGMTSSLTAIILLYLSCGWRPSRPQVSRAAIDDIKFGANLTIANLATFFVTSGDNMIIGAMNGPVALGIYDRSYRLVVQPIGQMLSPVSNIAIPLLSRLQHNHNAYAKVYLTFVRYILLITVPPMIFCGAESQGVVRILLGERWILASPTFAWISCGGLVSGIYSSLIWLFVSQGRGGEMRRIVTAAAAINVSSFFVGAFWGVVGVAAVGTMVFIFVTTPLVGWRATISGAVTRRALIATCAPYAFAGLISIKVASVARGFSFHSLWNELFVVGLCIAICFWAIVMTFPGERQSIMESVRHLRRWRVRQA